MTGHQPARKKTVGTHPTFSYENLVVRRRLERNPKMPCNCGGAPPQRVIIYQLNLPDGTFREYFTQREADAANERAGGIGTITITTR
ncbi:DUF7196 family protein [Streptomyces tubercidicus]|uniref:DUF7196 family protein n=1 Tax=Streptomyces tubercidicus TaxID=47759 RepID=UPI0036CD108C